MTLVDLNAAVSSAKPLELYLVRAGLLAKFVIYRQGNIASYAAGTADRKYPLGIRVDVYHRSALQHGGVQRVCSQQTDLLVGGEYRLEVGVLNIVGVQHRQGVSHRNAVVAAERRSLRAEKISVAQDARALLVHIYVGVRQLFGNDVGVPLENYSGSAAHTLGSGLFDYYVVSLVAVMLEPARFSEVHQVVGDRLRITRAAGNGGQCHEVPERQLAGLEIGKIYHRKPSVNKLTVIFYNNGVFFSSIKLTFLEESCKIILQNHTED